ncbi:MAG: 50S ribosomal protein L19 [Spirochaetia bacterium]|nr:50S ribosomal protein L19 [Spirochaetia bacterium]
MNSENENEQNNEENQPAENTAEVSVEDIAVAVEDTPATESEKTEDNIEKPKKEGSASRLTIKGGYINTSLPSDTLYKERPEFAVGDSLKVHYKIKEGDKERIQIFEGNVISIRGEGLGKTFTVRRIAHDVGVERIFPYHSPSIANLQVVRRGLVRRAKLYFLRGKSGKEGRIKEKISQSFSEKSKKKAAAKKKTAVKKKAPAAKKKGAAKKKTAKKSSAKKSS